MAREPHSKSEFLDEAAAGRSGLLAEFWGFIKYNKKWWLVPILVVMLLASLLVILMATPAAPFIYTLF